LISQVLAQYILIHYDGLIIDEVHYLKDWSLHIKSLYDSFPNKPIWLSDSSSIVLRKRIADLSRRFVVHQLPLMSLREYIYFETGKELSKIPNPFDKTSLQIVPGILREIESISKHTKKTEQDLFTKKGILLSVWKTSLKKAYTLTSELASKPCADTGLSANKDSINSSMQWKKSDQSVSFKNHLLKNILQRLKDILC